MPAADAEFLGLSIAKSWGLTPAEWRALDVDDRASMMASDLFEGTCTAYAAEYSSDYHDRKAGKGRSSGQNEFSEMKREMGI